MANLNLLFWLSLIPFATDWMGENHFSAMPMAIYGILLLMAAISYTILQYRIIKGQGETSLLSRAVGHDKKGKLSILFYVTAIVSCWWIPGLAGFLYILVALMC